MEYVEATLAAYKVRAVPININYRYTARELEHLFNDADLVGVVLSVGLHQPSGGGGVPSPDAALEAGYRFHVRRRAGLVVADEGLWPSIGRRSLHPLHRRHHGFAQRRGVATGRCILRLYGGWQSRPSRGHVRRRSWSSASRQIRAPSCSSLRLMHAAGGWVVLLHLFSGNKVVLWSGSLDPREVWRTIEREKVTATSTVGDAVMRPLLDAWDDFDPKPDIESLAVVSSGGAPLVDRVARSVPRATFPSIPLSDGYGSSETGIQAGRIFLGPVGEKSEPQFTAQQAVVLDEETHRPVVPGSGVVGRVARSGRIPLAYYKDPVKSAATFVEWDGRRWSLTGDMGTVADDGTITLLGRGNLCINTGGEKVYPEEVEGVLRQSSAVYDVVVVGIPDERWGQRVVAVVQPSSRD